MDAASARSCVIPGPRFLPETGMLCPALAPHSSVPLGKSPAVSFLALAFFLPSYQGSDQMPMSAGLPSSHILQTGMEALFFGGLLCKDPGIPAFTDNTTDPMCSCHCFPRRPDECVLTHTHAQPESLVTKLCIFRRAGRATGAAFGMGQPEPSVPRWGITVTLLVWGRGTCPQSQPVWAHALLCRSPCSGCQLCSCIDELLLFQIIMENLTVKFLGQD